MNFTLPPTAAAALCWISLYCNDRNSTSHNLIPGYPFQLQILLLGCWAIGLLVYRFIGLLGYRFIVSWADWPWGSDIEKKTISIFSIAIEIEKNNPAFFQYSRLVLLTNLDQYRRPIWNNIFWRYFQYWPWRLPSSISCLKESCRDVERWRQKSSGWSCWHGPATPNLSRVCRQGRRWCFSFGSIRWQEKRTGLQCWRITSQCRIYQKACGLQRRWNPRWSAETSNSKICA